MRRKFSVFDPETSYIDRAGVFFHSARLFFCFVPDKDWYLGRRKKLLRKVFSASPSPITFFKPFCGIPIFAEQKSKCHIKVKQNSGKIYQPVWKSEPFYFQNMPIKYLMINIRKNVNYII